MNSKKVAIIMGSDSDLPVVKKAGIKLKAMGIPFSMHIMSAHRTPKEVVDFVSGAKDNEYGVIIAAAGMAAHLAGVIAGHTTLPVIGIPMKSAALEGMDALLATVQMPPGVPVATVAINGAENAAVLAAQILGVADVEIADKLENMKKAMSEAVIEKNKKLQQEINEI